MSGGWGARRTHGSMSDLVGGRAAKRDKRCAGCGVLINDNRKTYCSPCYDERLEMRVKARRRRRAECRIAHSTLTGIDKSDPADAP